ncbi:hypothetical protein BX666DRAFT_1360177 [Dichotomocladium elegans]|nr:hypothetical protein BX666DRAFT_1360177 [Dichotomocladium elegans]
MPACLTLAGLTCRVFGSSDNPTEAFHSSDGSCRVFCCSQGGWLVTVTPLHVCRADCRSALPLPIDEEYPCTYCRWVHKAEVPIAMPACLTLAGLTCRVFGSSDNPTEAFHSSDGSCRGWLVTVTPLHVCRADCRSALPLPIDEEYPCTYCRWVHKAEVPIAMPACLTLAGLTCRVFGSSDNPIEAFHSSDGSC